ncbi:ABC transporter substrate-binding protein [Neomegalonema sp.]|uniref:ABC transporter substrate-binding protein n=1 Tax=Neomegalonema sp. TaxID=2039713 RepID=UPI0026124B0B|nr:ABC transporter substrate-binding protein [Neomegalonema sp.]MDD2869996.1 ABC transporter substrate-binding protein [Neomegalonema sp.]
MQRIFASSLAGAILLASAGGAFARDSLTAGEVLEPPGLDPTANAASAIRRVTYANLYEGLVRVAEDGSVQPGLAESWAWSPEDLAYTFKLREGVKFHDGAPFDCSVVKFSYERAVAPDSVNAQKGLFEPIESTECPDPLTAVVKLKRAAPNFLFGMGWGDAVMISPASAETNKTNPVGTGPFRFKRWVQGDRVELERNPDYWGEPAPLASVTFKFISDPSAAAAAVLSGEVDYFGQFEAAELLERLRADPDLQVDIGSTTGKVMMSLNNARAPFDDLRVRRALAHAIDRPSFVEAVNSGYGLPIGSHQTPAEPGYVDLSETYPYDPDKARALLAEAGVKPGTRFTLVLPPPAYARRGGEVIAAYLAEVGIQVDLVPVEFAQWLDQVFARADYDATIIAHTEARDLDVYARDFYYYNYDDPEYKALYRDYAGTVDEAARLELLGELQRKLAADEPNVYLYALPKISVRNGKLQGVWSNLPLPVNDLTRVRWAE